MKNQKGFSLIELLIVVVIIGIIAAIAIPNLLAARRAANEGSALSASRMLHTAQFTWAGTSGNGNYADDLKKLSAAEIVDNKVTDDLKGKSGYIFSTKTADKTDTETASFAIGARPTIATGPIQFLSGVRRFCLATDGIFYTYSDTEGGDPTRSGTTITCEPISADNGGKTL